MMMNKVFKNFMLSIAIVVVYAGFLFLLFYPEKGPLGKSFGIATIYMFTAYIALIVGIVLIITRLLKVVKDPSTLFYLLIASLNIGVIVTALLLFLFDKSDFSWVRQTLLNLLIGVLMIGDLLMFSWRESDL